MRTPRLLYRFVRSIVEVLAEVLGVSCGFVIVPRRVFAFNLQQIKHEIIMYFLLTRHLADTRWWHPICCYPRSSHQHKKEGGERQRSETLCPSDSFQHLGVYRIISFFPISALFLKINTRNINYMAALNF